MKRPATGKRAVVYGVAVWVVMVFFVRVRAEGIPEAPGGASGAATATVGAPNETGAATGARKITLKVMTINVRHFRDYWEERFPLIADEIVRLSPDLIGFQELQVDIKQAKTLLNLIDERTQGSPLKYYKYEHLKTGKEMLSGEGVGIFSRYPIEREGWADLNSGRVVVFARVSPAEGLTVDFYNTHLHNTNDDALKTEQARKIMEMMAKNEGGFTTFLTGDMNSTDGSGTIGFIMSNSFVDTYKAFHGAEETAAAGNTSPVVMSKENAPQNFVQRIDFVFVKPAPGGEGGVRILDSVVCFKNADSRGLYPSDHLGVMTTFEITYYAESRSNMN